ncbi:MAG: alpha/beta hydrolase [Fibrobacteria bacterium]|jgi:acetyl esterase/lipase|nr:alpha/beta hydrolase [Fibrobacteria bacterium]
MVPPGKIVRTLLLIFACLSLLSGRIHARLPDTTVTYARVDSLDLKLDLYLVGRPTGEGQPPNVQPFISPLIVPPLIRRPLIVWIHGGGWRGGSRADFSPAWTWVDSGYSVASLDYRLSQQKKWPAQLKDVKAAIRWLRANADAFALDTARFIAWGESAGGHLAAMAGLTTPADAFDGEVEDSLKTSSHVRGVIDYYGPTNFLEPIPKRWTPWSSVGELLGCGVRKCMDRARWASPVSYVNPGDVPFLIVHGTLDTTVPLTQSLLLDSLLRAAQVPVELRTVEGEHGGPAFLADSTLAWVSAFLTRVLGPVAPAPGPALLPAPRPGVPEAYSPGSSRAP